MSDDVKKEVTPETKVVTETEAKLESKTEVKPELKLSDLVAVRDEHGVTGYYSKEEAKKKIDHRQTSTADRKSLQDALTKAEETTKQLTNQLAFEQALKENNIEAAKKAILAEKDQEMSDLRHMAVNDRMRAEMLRNGAVEDGVDELVRMALLDASVTVVNKKVMANNVEVADYVKEWLSKRPVFQSQKSFKKTPGQVDRPAKANVADPEIAAQKKKKILEKLWNGET
jgi:hypothetical protein